MVSNRGLAHQDNLALWTPVILVHFTFQARFDGFFQLQLLHDLFRAEVWAELLATFLQVFDDLFRNLPVHQSMFLNQVLLQAGMEQSQGLKVELENLTFLANARL